VFLKYFSPMTTHYAWKMLQINTIDNIQVCWWLFIPLFWKDHSGRIKLQDARTPVLTAPLSGCTLPPRKCLGTHSCLRSSGPSLLNAYSRNMSLKISKDHTENRNRNLPPCGAVCQKTACNYKILQPVVWWTIKKRIHT